MVLSDRLKEFYFHLDPPRFLPDGIEVMNPYSDPYVREVCSTFFDKYFNDNRKRILMLGINPGRFGAGVTGITFTDPIRLERECGIRNSFKKRLEISSVFIYEVIRSYGGPEQFFSNFLLSAISPLGFLKKGKNVNYYDTRELLFKLKPFITSALKKQVAITKANEKIICLGEGRNYWYLKKLNKEMGLFTEIKSLPHPRWIMQYRFRNKRDYVKEYIRILEML